MLIENTNGVALLGILSSGDDACASHAIAYVPADYQAWLQKIGDDQTANDMQCSAQPYQTWKNTCPPIAWLLVLIYFLKRQIFIILQRLKSA